MTDFTNMTVAELSGALGRREVSAVELTAAYLSNMAEREEEINAYITPTAELALRQAAAADEMRRGCERLSPLCGIPYAAKDNFAVAGVRMTCASKMLEQFAPAYTAAVCERIGEAGGVLLGKTNLDEFAMGSACERSIAGATRNPLDPNCSAGGSSGGSAAAVAAGEAAWALGSDTGGSARQPASFCGLVSLKPTYGRISRRGMAEFASSMDTVCPITKTVRDAALTFAAMAGADPGDMTSIESDEDFLAELDEGVAGLTIGILSPSDLAGCGAGVLRCLERAAKRLESLGARLKEVSLPLETALELYLSVACAECASNMARYDGLRYGLGGVGDDTAEWVRSARSEGFGDEVKRRVLTGLDLLSARSTDGLSAYRHVRAERAAVCAGTEDVLRRVDAVLLPTTAGAAFPLGSFAARPGELYQSDRFTTIANLTGCPAIQLPGGGDGHLPYGISLLGRKRSEARLLRIAQTLEHELFDDVREEVHAHDCV